MDADGVGKQREQAHHDEDGRDDRRFPEQLVVGPTDQKKHDATPDRKAREEKQRRSAERLPNRHEIHSAVQREAEGDRDDYPADRVVNDGRGHDNLPNLAAQKIHLAHDHRNDLDRRDRQRGAQKQRRDQAEVGLRQHGRGEELAEREAASERKCDARDRHAERGASDAPYEAEIGLHAGDEQQQKNAELRHRVEHGLLVGPRREQGGLHAGQNRTEHGRPEQDARDQLAHDGGLADPLHRFPEQPAHEE